MSLIEHPVFTVLLGAWAAAGAVAMVALTRVPAPYGRFARPGWGKALSPRLAWFLMESPPVFIAAAIFAASVPHGTMTTLFFALLTGHYFYRGFLYPLLLRSSRRVPLFVVLSAVGFHLANATLVAWELFVGRLDRPLSWMTDARFLLGIALFAFGFVTAVVADRQLARLRREPDEQYQIPRGWLFEHISCANYFGEIVEWCGWAIMTWTWSGWVFAFWVVANLLPRALAHHRWYRQHMPLYPQDRKAVLPYVL